MIPNSAFIDPFGSNLDAIRELVHRSIEIALRRRADAGNTKRPSKVDRCPVPTDVPRVSVDEKTLLEELETLIRASANPASSNFVAHMGAVSSTMSSIGDFIASCLNNNMIGL